MSMMAQHANITRKPTFRAGITRCATDKLGSAALLLYRLLGPAARPPPARSKPRLNCGQTPSMLIFGLLWVCVSRFSSFCQLRAAYLGWTYRDDDALWRGGPSTVFNQPLTAVRA